MAGSWARLQRSPPGDRRSHKKEHRRRWGDDTVDTFKAGDPSTVVTGVVTTSMATLDVLRGAVQAGANLVITAAPTFYSPGGLKHAPSGRGFGAGAGAGRGRLPGRGAAPGAAPPAHHLRGERAGDGRVGANAARPRLPRSIVPPPACPTSASLPAPPANPVYAGKNAFIEARARWCSADPALEPAKPDPSAPRVSRRRWTGRSTRWRRWAAVMTCPA